MNGILLADVETASTQNHHAAPKSAPDNMHPYSFPRSSRKRKKESGSKSRRGLWLVENVLIRATGALPLRGCVPGAARRESRPTNPPVLRKRVSMCHRQLGDRLF